MPFVKSEPYPFPFDGKLNKDTTGLVIIDMQNDFCAIGGYTHTLGYDISPLRKPLPNIQRLLELFRRLQFPIYHTREGHRADLSTLPPRELHRSRNNPNGIGIGDEGPLGRLLIRGSKGWEIIPELTPLNNEPIIDKPTKGAFTYTDFELLLRNRGIKNLILCGVCTDICVHTTMREAADRGYDCLLVSDACGATVEDFHFASIGMTGTEGGIFGATCNTQDVIEILESI